MADGKVSFEVEAIDKASSILNNISGALGGIGQELSNMVTLSDIARDVGRFLRETIELAAESETIMARLNATLISTGKASDVSAEAIGKMANRLQNISAFDDEAILSAYNAILKFENINTENMDAVVKAAMDMSAAFGGDLASNAEAIARVLETGLIPRTWGFSEALKEQISSMIEAGDSAGALSLVLDELNSRYGGQAAAQMNTYAGATAALKNQFDQLKESIGADLIPILTKLMTVLAQFYSIMNSLGDFGGGMKWQSLIPIYGQIDLILRDINAYNQIMNQGAGTQQTQTTTTGGGGGGATTGQYIQGPARRARGGVFSGWAMVGDAPGGGRTPYTEFVYAPHGAVVYNQAQMSGRAPAPSAAIGGFIPPAVTGAAQGDNSIDMREFARYIVDELRRVMN